MERIKINGMLCDDRVHMTAREYSEHKVDEDHYKRRNILRKLSGNPILTEDIRKAIRYAVYILDDNVWLRKQYRDLLDVNTALKKKAGITAYDYDELVEIQKIRRRIAKVRLREKINESEE